MRVRIESMDENELLNERLAQNEYRPGAEAARATNQCIPPQPISNSPTGLDLCQWQVGTNGTFRPAAKTVSALPAAAYSVQQDDLGPFLKEKTLLSDEIVELPDTANHVVLRSIRKFWESADRYREHGLIFKRGVLLWGPPGGGKTVTVHLLLRDVIGNDGIVVFCSNPRLTATLVSAIRKIEPARPLIVVLEDVDEIISEHGEHQILSMLDGEDQTDNVVYIACPAPETRILKADLTWVRADNLRSGDEIIAFDEHGPQRKYRTATVMSCPIITKPRYRITTDKGSITVSVGHPFLANLGTGRWHKWKMAESLSEGDRIAFVGAPWDTDETRDGGYLAGQYDAEGNLNFTNNQHGSLSFRVCWAQAIGAISSKVEALLSARKFNVASFNKKPIMGHKGMGLGKTGPHKPQVSFTVNGGKWENLRLLGSIRPTRLLSDKRLPSAWEGNRLCPKYAKVLSVEYIGEGPVVALDTSTNTFIGEGMLQHNTTNYPERLGARIVNRPSRFDERIFVGMPGLAARLTYLRRATSNGTVLKPAQLTRWSQDTDGFSIAHLRELVAAVLCLDQPYDDVLKRLKSMADRPKETDGFRKNKLGLL